MPNGPRFQKVIHSWIDRSKGLLTFSESNREKSTKKIESDSLRQTQTTTTKIFPHYGRFLFPSVTKKQNWTNFFCVSRANLFVRIDRYRFISLSLLPICGFRLELKVWLAGWRRWWQVCFLIRWLPLLVSLIRVKQGIKLVFSFTKSQGFKSHALHYTESIYIRYDRPRVFECSVCLKTRSREWESRLFATNEAKFLGRRF